MMQRAWLWLGATAILLAPPLAQALEPPHDESNNIYCSSCHAAHSSSGMGSGLLPRGAEQEAMCKSCHNPTGKASEMAGVANHVVGGGTIVDCGSCHDPHRRHTTTDPHLGGQTAPNLKLIRGDTGKYMAASALEPAIFQQRPDHFAFGESNPPWNGICQSCHTQTDHHRNDGTADHLHQIGVACTTCHPHEAGFLPQGGCSNCHAQPQGVRRQVVGAGGDFERASHHITGAVADSDCTVCHYVGDHQSGTVKLKDPDQGSSQVYSFSPDDPAALEGFCINCHDADGALAGNGRFPFSDGGAVPDIKGAAGSMWDDSAHKLIGYAQNGGNPISCFGDGVTSGCHGNAHGSDNEKLISSEAGALTVSGFCYQCHTEGKVRNDALSNNRPGGYVSADDIEEAFSKSRKHDLGTTFTVNGNTYTLECTTCHNPHVVTGRHWEVDQGYSPVTRPDLVTSPAANPRAMGRALWGAAAGEKMDDFAAQASGSGGWYYSTARGGMTIFDRPAVYQPPKAGDGYSFEFSGDVLPDYTTLCLDCHSYRMSPANPPVNWGQGVSCTGNSVDPPEQRIECGAQHGLGSANKPYYWGDVGKYGHGGNPDPIFSQPGVTRGRGAGHFMRWPYDSVERNAGINFVMSCTDCHEAHGSNRGGMIRERFSVNGNGDCGTGGDASPNGENCSDGGNWNSFCNACHYYYGGQHAGMSCGNASCHEANSIHRIIHNTESGGTYLWTEPSRPTTTPELETVTSLIGSDELVVTFAEGVYTNIDQTGALTPEDFVLTDLGGNNPRRIEEVTHSPGDSTAIVRMSAPLTEADAFVDTIATAGVSVWGTAIACKDPPGSTIPNVPCPAGPWPVTIPTGACPAGATSFELNEPAASSSVIDAQGVLLGTVGNPVVAIPGDGSFHGDESQGTFIDIDHPRCLKEASRLTIEARVKPMAVDLDWEDTNGDGIDDNLDRNATFSRVFERKRTFKVTILHADYRGDNVPERAGKASIEVKYFVDTASRHGCPHPEWPDDDYVGNDSRWHQVSTDIDQYPIVDNHWYRIRVVFNSDKSGIPGSNGIPVDIWVDDQGADGAAEPLAGNGELWSGFINIAKPTIQESSSCKWGALPGDLMAMEDQASYIGSPPSHGYEYLFKGLIDWVSWDPVADYSSVGDGPH